MPHEKKNLGGGTGKDGNRQDSTGHKKSTDHENNKWGQSRGKDKGK